MAEFKKSVLRFQRNSLWEPASQKKLWNKNIWGNFLTNLWLLMENFWPFCQNCILPVKQLFDGKQHLRVKYWLEIFFGHWAQTLNVLAILLTAQLYKLLSTCLKGKQFWVPIFEQKLWFWKNFQIFMIWRIHSKTSSVFFNELLAVLSKLHSRCPDD